MKKLRMNLLLSLLIYSLILITIIFYANQKVLLSNVEEQVQQSRELTEHHILADMRAVDNAHYYFDTNLTDIMKQELFKLRNYYKENPDVGSWDLEQLNEHHGMDIYILDKQNKVIRTTFLPDMGLNFSECCANFATLLDERRLSGEFYSDGIDVSTTTGQIRKFSYLATPDGNYLLEIGVVLEDVSVFETFNFRDTASKLKALYSDLIDVQTINSGGIFLNDSTGKRISVSDMPEKFQNHFKDATQSMKPTEYVVQHEQGHQEIHRFLPYEAETERGESTRRIVYVKYGNFSEQQAKQEILMQQVKLLALVLVTTVVLLLVISKLLEKTVKLATFDSLTGAYNRATYISKMDDVLKRRKGTPGLLLIDLDNFKLANDRFGHAVGDEVLKDLTRGLQEVTAKDGFVVRLGGDEFGIVLEDTDVQDMQVKATAVLQRVRQYKHAETRGDVWSHLSVSIGGAISEDPHELEIDLFVRADEALYSSKNAGKDQFTMAD